MKIEHLARDDGQMARQYDYGDETIVAVDFGAVEADAAVDVVDDTVIVVFEDDQRELELPADVGDAQAFMKNGVLTIEVEGDA
ncbi:Hsp20/alpha crystallin family protein [Natrialbaceae archaeon AArc-T1-2]|uniref:Hsp20/alpha crystallin family protein n=1 Tax=Natrialbaceae archaeon AArc-T1-2 TaxID=3053904 RepID=UPI00255B1151|nr:Hsp20/alpha crystallin family protein [Natrialbaceae archaeon AArc-T1-2]WIV68164.1 Hsp20/alpha crystallin family protein [Natrialbaceae archaeon AArc-T1-2]